jgi:PST family polysaccharide transporter
MSFVLRTGSMIVMARLLFPREFGLFGMVAAFTGFLSLFRDVGLSMASITWDAVTDDQLSNLFWVNVAVGTVLAGLCVVGAPVLAGFYHEPELRLITAALGAGFFFNGAAAQHRALLQRGMRFGVLATIDVIALIAGILAGVVLAVAGAGYWALVAMALSQPVIGAVGAWIMARWNPGWPRRRAGIRSMLWYGGRVTVNNVICYVAYNADKVLLGRFWGAEALGFYGRAYQLINIPTDNLNFTVSQVAFPALSRLQNDPDRLRRYFLEGWHLFLAVVAPVTVACGMFADDIVLVFLGAKWRDAALIFKLLTPTVLAFGLVNPFGWLLMATGHSARSLKISMMIGPTVVAGYLIGLSYGPVGVATGFSTAMVLLVPPILAWSIRGTQITARDVFKQMASPLVSVAVASAVSIAARGFAVSIESDVLRLVVQLAVFFGGYALVLLVAMREARRYRELVDVVFRTRRAA